jgi:hypothetical protein
MVLHGRLSSERRQRRIDTKKEPRVHQKQLWKKKDGCEVITVYGPPKQVVEEAAKYRKFIHTLVNESLQKYNFLKEMLKDKIIAEMFFYE